MSDLALEYDCSFGIFQHPAFRRTPGLCCEWCGDVWNAEAGGYAGGEMDRLEGLAAAGLWVVKGPYCNG